MFNENQLLSISALQHLIFCERQCALIHVEQLWAENVLTVEGRQLHEKAHDGTSQTSGNVRIARSLWLKSSRLGLIGQADVVEFHLSGGATTRIIPVEYKRGRPKKDDSDRVQICAQALCLEEMCDVPIRQAYLFYGKQQRRSEVAIDDALRDLTLAKIQRLRQIIDSRETPAAIRMPKCDKCSLIELCIPDAQRLRRGVNTWTDRQFMLAQDCDQPETDPFDTGLQPTD